jgi:VanZ family protein
MANGDGPDPHDAEARRAARWLAVCAVLITLGSLYPWHFTWPRSMNAAWAHMMNQPSWWTGARDVIGNVALFVPLGGLGWVAMRRARLPVLPAATLVLAGGLAFAFAVQVAQIFVPRRDAAWSDVVWNTVGLLMGLLLARPLMRWMRTR